MKRYNLLILALSAILLVGCGKDGTTTPDNGNTDSSVVADTGGPKVTGEQMGGGGYVGAGQKALIATFKLSAETTKIIGTPKLTFKGLSGSNENLLTATCSLADSLHLACEFAVTVADVGKASDGVRFDDKALLSGGGTMGKDGKTAPLSQSFSGGTITIGGTRF